MQAKKQIILFLFIFILYSVFSFNLNWDSKSFPNTDINQNYLFSEKVKETNKLEFKQEENENYSLPIFGIRGTAVKSENTSVPTSMFGFIFALGIIRKASDYLIPFINPLFATLAIVYLYHLTKLLFKDSDTIPILSTLLFTFSAPLIFTTAFLYNNILSLFLFLASVYHLYNYLEKEKYLDIWLFLTFLVAAFFVRYVNILFAMPLIIYLFKEFKFNENKLKAIPLAVLGLGSFFLFLYLNIRLYGDLFGFLRPGFILGDFTAFTEAVNQSSLVERIFPFNLNDFFVNLWRHMITVNPFITTGFIFGVGILVKAKRKELLPLFFVIILQLLFYLGRGWSGEAFTASVGTSYARYLLITTAFTAVFTAVALDYLATRQQFFRRVIIFLIPLYILFNFYLFFAGPLGYSYFVATKRWNDYLIRQVDDRTRKDSVFYVGLTDKYFYPYRTTAIITSIQKEERLQKLAELIRETEDNKKAAYYVGENKVREDEISESDYLEFFNRNGFWFQKVIDKNSGGLNVYEIRTK